MPYVPSKKTDGVSDDREAIDPIEKQLAVTIRRRLENMVKFAVS